MDDVVTATVAAIRAKIPCLGQAALGPEYSYHSLPLCVIDAVFSIGVRYRNAQKAVDSWCAAQTPNWPKERIAGESRHAITDLTRATDGFEGVALAERFFGGNRQRTSSRRGILKADAVVQFAKALQHAGVDDFADIQNAARVERACEAVRSIAAQGSGLSFRYFLMLAGDKASVKPDRMLCRFVEEATGRPGIPSRSACDAVVGAARVLAAEFPNLTPRLLDHLIWSCQRARPASKFGAAASRAAAKMAG